MAKEEDIKTPEKISQDQIHKLLFGRELSWQAIIHDLINSEQLDPWDIDLILLSQKYLEKIRELEEADFIVGGKVLLAAALLLKMKSDILLNREIRDLDDILFDRKKEEKKPIEKIEIDENKIPKLFPRTPLPRFRKVTLNELMVALDKAMKTENRRIRRTIMEKNALRDAGMTIPHKKINIHDEIRKLHKKIKLLFKKHKSKDKLSFTELAGRDKKARVATFVPLLHLDSMEKIWLEQKTNFDEIWILLYELYKKQNMQKLQEAVVEEIEKVEEMLDDGQKKRLEKINKDFSNPIDEVIEEELEK